jgi:gag-polyprotein putative aspartyl protease
MIRFRYVDRSPFPAPFVYASVRSVDTQQEARDIPAQVDPGADRTVLPTALVPQLGLVQRGSLPLAGFAGEVISYPTYYVDIAIRSLPFVTVRVVAHEGEPYVLLGRDVLNHFRIILDGPQQAVEID